MAITKSSIHKLAIIGGGPIGLYLGIKLAKMGHQVDLFEKGTWPKDKVCGQGIMPSGFELLNSIGVHFNEQEESQSFLGIEYIDGDLQVAGKLPKAGRGVERKILSEKLYQAAKAQENLKLFDHYKIQDLSIFSEYFKVFACDGLNSQTRTFLGLDKKRKGALRMGARVHYQCAPWSKNVQVFWENGVEAYVTPVSATEVEVAYLWYQDKMIKGPYLEDRLLKKFPSLKENIGSSSSKNDFKGYGPFSTVAKRNHFGKFFLVGDAYGFLDGITGEGISLGLKSANIIAKNFENYGFIAKCQIKLLYLHYGFLVNLALLFSTHLKLRIMTLRIFKKFPKLFNLILSLNDFTFQSNKEIPKTLIKKAS